MKIAYYCQNVLGIGHLHRSLEICSHLAENNSVTMITGGALLPDVSGEVDVFQLPGLMMDAEFNNLAPCDSEKSLAETKKRRAEMMYAFFRDFRPDVFLVELYPFGRKAFRFELDPVLEGIKEGRLPACLCFCSLRDILVERQDREKFENRIISTLNSLFDGLLIHADQKLISLDATFSRAGDITIPIAYTGYVTPSAPESSRLRIREKYGISADASLVIASIGGGAVGSELLFAVKESLRLIDDKRLSLHIFTGPYAPDSAYEALKNSTDPRIRVRRFTPSFIEWLKAADLSISMAGYNTTMNILSTGIPALLYPFRHNQEQNLRVSRLQAMAPLKILSDADLLPDTLASHILRQLKEKRYRSPVCLDGARNTASIVEKWCRKGRI